MFPYRIGVSGSGGGTTFFASIVCMGENNFAKFLSVQWIASACSDNCLSTIWDLSMSIAKVGMVFVGG
jgi:hypothetical protein